MRNVGELLGNFHWIEAGKAARSAQLHALALGPFLASHRIAAMVNLRGAHPEFGWWRREIKVCRARGVRHFDVLLDSRRLPTRTMLANLMEAFEIAPRPLLIKCSGGQDRTSLAAALYLLWGQGWDARARAMGQFSRLPYLHFPKPAQRWLRLLPNYAETEAQGRPLADWIRDAYDPAAFAAWLEKQGQAASHGGLYRHASGEAPLHIA